jgi:Ca2+/Na+ antiporter
MATTLACLSSLCVFVLSFDLFIFVLCICAVIWLVQIHRAKINKSNDRTNTQSEDKQVKLQNKYWFVYLRSVYLFCNLTCLSSLCVFGLSFDLFIFVLCICSVIWLVYLTEQIHRTKINKWNHRTNTQSEDKQVKLQYKYTERR